MLFYLGILYSLLDSLKVWAKMSDRNVFDAMQAELRPHYDSDDADSSEDEYVPSVSIQRKIFWKRI